MLSSVVTSVVEKVFPVGTEIYLDGQDGPPESRFWLISSKENEPRWILPHERDHAWPLLRGWCPYNFFSRFKWQCLMAAYRGKMLDHVPGIVPLRIIVPLGKSWDHLGWSFAEPPVPVIYIGTPSPFRKAILGLIDSQTRKVTSICRAPLGPAAGHAINHEVDILNKLALEKPGRAPHNLFVDRKNGISAQEFIAGSPTGRRFTESHLAFLVDLAISGETISLREVVEDMGRKIKARDNIDPKAQAVLERVLADIDDPSPLPAVWEHGDFAPWNLKSMTDSSLRAIDWETSFRHGLPLFDLVFFYSMRMFLFGEKELFPKSFWVFLRRYLEQLDISPLMTGKIVRACIARDLLRCYETDYWSRAAFLIRMLAKPLGDLA